MTSIEIGLVIFLAYLCLYGLVSRVCKCIESCALSKMFGSKVDSDTLQQTLKEITHE